MFYKIKKEVLFSYLLKLKNKLNIDILFPIEKESFINYTNLSDDILANIKFKMSMIPPTHFLFKNLSTLLEFENSKAKQSNDDTKKTMIFMPYPDIIAYYILDKIFLENPVDEQYKKIRDKIILVEFEEEEIDEYNFTHHIFFEDNHDIKLIKLRDCFIIHIRTDKGKIIIDKELAKRYGLEKEEHQPKERKFLKTFLTDIKIKDQKDEDGRDMNDSVFAKHSRICIACGACTLLCPTCNCFVVEDVIDSIKKDKDGKLIIKGKRVRTLNSCQFLDYHRIAGNFYFVKTIADRMKYRIYHKFKYFKERYGITMCSGCGRCTRYCPANIKLIDILKEIVE